MKDLMSLFFETTAFKIAPENTPFWYTSGKIGPYFVNADYLYGSEEDSKNLLSFIDSELENEDKVNIPSHIFAKTLEHYNENSTYKFVIDSMIECIKSNINLDEIDYISGGERRDWYFSNIVAYLLKKPHITIYKDLSTVESNFDFSENANSKRIENKKFLHVADLLNKSSSFTRAWIPAIKNLGSNILWTLFAVDRVEGGTEVLSDEGIKVLSLLQVDDFLFQKALELDIINEKQLEMLRNFKKDPDGSMKKFLLAHPEFIEDSLKSDNSRTQKRVHTLIEQNIYGLNLKF